MYKIEKPPFYAAWATPVIHDTRVGLAHQRELPGHGHERAGDRGLYCGGESAGGFSMHGLARCLTQGYIAGHKAHAETIV